MYLLATVPRQVAPPPLGKLHECSQEWKASDVEHCGADVPAAAAAEVEVVVMATVE